MYGQLHMLDLPTAAARRRAGAHGTFKARVYASLPLAALFVESEAEQAAVISRASGKPVLDTSTWSIVPPRPGVRRSGAQVRHTLARARQALVRLRDHPTVLP